MTSLFDRLGGDAAIHRAVDDFYVRVLADERIRHFFEGVDMTRQRAHQFRFLKVAFGGAPAYSGRSLRAAHGPLVERMGLNDSHFDAVVENLGQVLAGLGVAPALIAEVAAVAEGVRGDVLGR